MAKKGWIIEKDEAEHSESNRPPRRVYSLTAAGEAVLVEWAGDLKQWRARIDRFLRAYQQRMGNDGQERPERGE